MSRTIQRTELFEEDFVRQFGWYAREARATIAWRFHTELGITLRRLSNRPDLGRIRHFRDPRLHGLRSCAVDKPFGKLLIFYRASDDAIHAIRLMHGARDLSRRLLEIPGSESACPSAVATSSANTRGRSMLSLLFTCRKDFLRGLVSGCT